MKRRKTSSIIGLTTISLVLCTACAPATSNTNGHAGSANTAQTNAANPSNNNAVTSTTNQTSVSNDTSSTRHTSSSNTTIPSTSTVAASSKPTSGSSFSQLQVKSPNAMSFATKQDGYAACNDGIYYTSDGGQTWIKVYSSTVPVLGIDAKYQSNGKLENVIAYTKTYLLHRTNRQKFVKEPLPKAASKGGKPDIQAVSLLPDATLWLVNAGKVWVSGGMNGALSEASPSANVQDVAAVNVNTAYAISGKKVYKTTDHGKNWSVVYTPPLQAESPNQWKSEIQADGKYVATYFYGGAAGMSQQAFVMYESTDSGKSWNAMFDEGYYQTAYGSPKVLSSKNLGGQPGPFALLPSGDIVFGGIDVTTDNVMVSVVSPQGQTSGPVTVGNSIFDVFQHLSLAAPDGQHIFVMGSKKGVGVMMKSSDGGKSWTKG